MKVWTCRTETQRKKLGAYFAGLCRNWASRTGVNHWDIDVIMEFGIDVTQGHRDSLGGQSGGITICNPAYERATIYLCTLDVDTHFIQREIEEMAAHEVVHILLSPITNSFSGDGDDFLRDRTIESIVTRTSRALLGWFD